MYYIIVVFVMIMDLQTLVYLPVFAVLSHVTGIPVSDWLLVNVYKTNARANQLFMWILQVSYKCILYIV
jgi:hypothetical protein